MRYYDIQITNDDDGSPVYDSTGKQIGPFTSLMSTARSVAIAGRNVDIGTTNLAALNVYIDMPVVAYDSPQKTAGLIRIWGLPLKYISQATNLNGKRIVVRGGMSTGLPLANPAQQGILVTAVIQQAFGNWQGTNQTLDMYVVPSAGGPLAPKNITFKWEKDTKMAVAIENSLKTAFADKGYKIEIDISDNLVAYETIPGYYHSVNQFAGEMRSLSVNILKNNLYPGVQITFENGTFYVYDVKKPGVIAANPRFINFEDLIGQPTWSKPLTVTFKTVMRGDIQMGDYIKFPIQTSAYQAITSGSQSQERQRSAFNGVFFITSVHHWGEFRQKGGDNWVTVFEAQPV